MSTTGEQVQVTPELLAAVEEKAIAATPQGEWIFVRGEWNSDGHDIGSPGSICGALDEGGEPGLYVASVAGSIWRYEDDDESASAALCEANGEFMAAASPAVMLALVQRIHELEDEVESLAGRLLLEDTEGRRRIRELESERAAMREEEDWSGPMPGEQRVTLEEAHGGATIIGNDLTDSVNIWSGEHRSWWCANGRGYTPARRSAGVYTFQDAYARTSHCGPEKQIVFLVAKYTP